VDVEGSRVRITDVRTHVLVVPTVKANATSSAQDDFVVEIETDEGIIGIGEADLNPWIARACVEAPSTHSMGLSLRGMLIGEDPLDPDRLWQKLYDGSAMNGRRGAVIHALGALDIALWDIAGKVAGVPIFKLLGGEARPIRPYASLLPDAATFADFKPAIVDWALRAKEEFGFRAVKLELIFDGPYAHQGIRVGDDKVTEVVDAVRAAVGPDVALMVDVGYAWDNVDRAAACISQWKDLDVLFVETPLRSDDIAGYAELHQRDLGIKIAAGEWLATRFEFQDLIDRGLVDIAQPDVGRVGGFGEALRVARHAEREGRLIVPHAWKSGISIAAAAHLAAATPNCIFIEYLPAALTDSLLRQSLVADDIQMVDGEILLGETPGLGVNVSPEAIKRFAATD
jgi:L-alanine-DL-glutamate epimerase-like enolase superfamily enzyme